MEQGRDILVNNRVYEEGTENKPLADGDEPPAKKSKPDDSTNKESNGTNGCDTNGQPEKTFRMNLR